MVQRLIFLMVLCFLSGPGLYAQSPGRQIRVVDTLTADEAGRTMVLLKTELDSLVRLHSPLVRSEETLPLTSQQNDFVPVLLAGIIIFLVVLVAIMAWLIYRNQKKALKVSLMLHKQIRHLEQDMLTNFSPGTKVNGKSNGAVLEKKIHSLTAQLEKLTAEKEELVKSLTANTGIVSDFAAIKQKMMDVYKIRNYPGFDKGKTETDIVKSLLDTERSVAIYAYEHFLKPVMSIADFNKNNPAKISKEDRERMLNLLISLSLLYSEYLYLRINDLSVGGKIIERIGSLQNGNKIDPALLKELNTEHGSRALVLRIALDKTAIQNLSYPVFDETNLNLS
jgi:hypothetical protein